MAKVRILIIDQDQNLADYFRRTINNILSDGEVIISSNIEEIPDQSIFSVIILDTESVFEKIDKNLLDRIIICSRDSIFVQKAIAESRNVILRSQDFYDAISYKLFAKELV